MCGETIMQEKNCAAVPASSAPSAGSRFPFTAFFTGWYRVAACSDVAPGKMKSLHVFGQDLVVFRDATGIARVFDAHCPHLGAHFGEGKVEGDTLRCGFHGWRFDGQGHCVAAGQARKVPRAQVRAWPMAEVDGAIMVWFDRDGRAPMWDAASLPEFTDRGNWTRFRAGRTRIVRTHIQDLAENGCDVHHFMVAHGDAISDAKTLAFERRGETLRHLMSHRFKMPAFMRRLTPFGEGTLEFSYMGLGKVAVRAKLDRPFALDYLTVMYFTPIDAEHASITAEFSIKRRGLATPFFYALSMRGSDQAIADDMKIMETKAYQPRPRLSEMDGPILQFRRWAQQFHVA